VGSQYFFQDFLFAMLYGGVALTAIFAGSYLVLRRANCFAPEINSPLSIRRSTAAFLFALAASHLWWLLLYYQPIVEPSPVYLMISLGLDVIITMPLLLNAMASMMQDRKHPCWPILVSVIIGLTVLLLSYMAKTNMAIGPIIGFAALLLFNLGVLIRYIWKYGQWLKDNYADLEYKEVWQNLIILFAFMLLTIVYGLVGASKGFEIVTEFVDILLVLFLVWRVENLQTLEESADDTSEEPSEPSPAEGLVFTKIETLLEKYCIEQKYYLHKDVTLSQLAKLIGTNRTYLSQYFGKRGLSYNAYINGLRIQNFKDLYKEAMTSGRPFTAAQLSLESGFSSYSTFSAAFKQYEGQTVSSWMQENDPNA